MGPGRRAAIAAVWPILVATAAPTPPAGFASGVNGLPRGLQATLDEARAVGFNAVRVFLSWDEIERVEGVPDWTCKYLGRVDRGRDIDHDGKRDSWPGIPCDGTPCGCGYSADDRVAMVAGDPRRLPVLLTLVGTPRWARGERAPRCPARVPGRALPLRPGKESAFRHFAAAAARRYGDVVYAFELWNEPDLAGCLSWAGTAQQFKEQILTAAGAVKRAAVSPGLVVAPTLVNPSGGAMDAWMNWSQPVDFLSFNLYVNSVGAGLAKIDEMDRWCRTDARCPGFYVTEFGAQWTGASRCPGPRIPFPGRADAAIMRRCRRRRSCAGFFLYRLTDQARPRCDEGLFDERGCRKRRLCEIAGRFFHVTPPFPCGGCGP
jgi:hypothetical protein